MPESLYVKKFADDAVLPIRKSTDAAGYDLSSNEDITIDSKATGENNFEV